MGAFNIPNLTLKGNQNQHLVLTQAMQRSLYVLQLPVEELSDFLEQELIDNPALERLDSSDEYEPQEEHDASTAEEMNRTKAFQESLLTYHTSMFEHLMTQARERFENEADLRDAQEIIGNLNERGYYTEPITDDRMHMILTTIQSFHPPGIAARDLRDSLLIQLREKGKQDSKVYELVTRYFEALLQNRRPFLQKKLKISPQELTFLIKEIATLNFHPASSFRHSVSAHITPDLYLDFHNENWEVRINDEPMPLFRLSPEWMQLATSDLENNSTIRQHLAAGKWLIRILFKRERTLRALAAFLIKHNAPFLLGKARCHTPLVMKELAELLGVHESTITRAISGKYLLCPAGLFSIRSFFSEERKTAKTLLKDLIQKENKKAPFSDDILSQKISAHGFPCARRTIAKYRRELNIPPKHLRKT